jgi:hypothetical protein
MDLTDLFDSITIINTVHRTDRREELQCLLRWVPFDRCGFAAAVALLSEDEDPYQTGR